MTRPYDLGQLIEQRDLLREMRQLSRRSITVRALWGYAVTRIAHACTVASPEFTPDQNRAYGAALRALVSGDVLFRPGHLFELVRAARARGSAIRE